MSTVRAVLVLCVGVGVLGGCAMRSPTPGDVAAWPEYWSPHRLYLAADPYPALHVEVDAVAGCEPTDAELAALRAFLEQHCDKPGGIRIARDSVIARQAAGAAGDQRLLAAQHLSGPPSEADQPTAFLYVLYYDSSLWGGEAGNPRFQVHPYPASIWMDRAYASYWARDHWDRMLLHEAGHALGLARHGDAGHGLHCPDQDCLMAEHIRISAFRRVLGMRPSDHQSGLCEQCVQVLASERGLDTPVNARFLGPWVVRPGEGYEVLTLPFVVLLSVGELQEADLAERRDKLLASEVPIQWFYSASGEGERQIAAVRRGAVEATGDPYRPVRELAEELLQALDAHDD